MRSVENTMQYELSDLIPGVRLAYFDTHGPDPLRLCVLVRWVDEDTVYYTLEYGLPNLVKSTSVGRFMEIVNLSLDEARKQAKWGWL